MSTISSRLATSFRPADFHRNGVILSLPRIRGFYNRRDVGRHVGWKLDGNALHVSSCNQYIFNVCGAIWM